MDVRTPGNLNILNNAIHLGSFTVDDTGLMDPDVRNRIMLNAARDKRGAWHHGVLVLAALAHSVNKQCDEKNKDPAAIPALISFFLRRALR